MWPWGEQAEAFKALSYGDKWRVTRCLTRGEAPRDPRMAPAAVELAESYQRLSPFYLALLRWAPVLIIVGAGSIALAAAVEGDQVKATRPKNVARSLEASKRVVASGLGGDQDRRIPT
jgi:hypothetical protein